MPVPVAALRAPGSTVEQRGIGRAAVTESDRQLLIMVRPAGLWGIPAGQSATQQAESPVVKEVGAQIARLRAAHLTLVERTGKVDFGALPEPVLAGAAAPAHPASETPPDTGGGINVGLLRMFRVR